MKKGCLRFLFFFLLVVFPLSLYADLASDMKMKVYGHVEFMGAMSTAADYNGDDDNTTSGGAVVGIEDKSVAYYTIDWLGLNTKYTPTQGDLKMDFEVNWEAGIQREINRMGLDTLFLHRRIEGIGNFWDKRINLRAGIAPLIQAPSLRGHSMNLEQAWVGALSFRTRLDGVATAIADPGTLTFDQLSQMGLNFSLLEGTMDVERTFASFFGQRFADHFESMKWTAFFLRYIGAVASWAGIHTYGTHLTYDFTDDLSGFLGLLFHRDKTGGVVHQDKVFSLGGQVKAMDQWWNLDWLAELWWQWGDYASVVRGGQRSISAGKWRAQAARDFDFWKSRVLFSWDVATGEDPAVESNWNQAYPIAALAGDLAEFNSTIKDIIELPDVTGSPGNTNFWALSLFWDFDNPIKAIKDPIRHNFRVLYKQAWQPRVGGGQLPMMVEWRFTHNWHAMKSVTLSADWGFEHPLSYYTQSTGRVGRASDPNFFIFTGVKADLS